MYNVSCMTIYEENCNSMCYLTSTVINLYVDVVYNVVSYTYVITIN